MAVQLLRSSTILDLKSNCVCSTCFSKPCLLFRSSRLLKHLKELLPKNSSDKSKSRILIFALYKAEAARLTQTLERNGYGVASLHGDLSQSQRTAALEDFKLGRKRLMVATDVAARGLDIPEVEVVINYTFPLTVENYVHRIGRTGT